jgi:hypothetical protein
MAAQAPNIATALSEMLSPLGFKCHLTEVPNLVNLHALRSIDTQLFEFTYTWQSGTCTDAWCQLKLWNLESRTNPMEMLISGQRVHRVATVRQLLKGCVRFQVACKAAFPSLATV